MSVNWKNILYQNLCILDYKFVCTNSKHENENLFENPNSKALCDIMVFLMGLVDRKMFEENYKLSFLNDEASKREFLRNCYKWSKELIASTFQGYTLQMSVLVAPAKVKIYEFLAKLTTVCLLMLSRDKYKLDSESIRQPVNLHLYQMTKAPLFAAHGSLQCDFHQATVLYLSALKKLSTRKKFMEEKLRTRLVQIEFGKRELDLKIESLNGIRKELQELIGNECPSRDFLQSAFDRRMDHLHERRNMLMVKFDSIINCCSSISRLHDISVSDYNTLDKLSNLSIKTDPLLVCDDGRLQFAHVLRRTANSINQSGTSPPAFTLKESQSVADGLSSTLNELRSQQTRCTHFINQLHEMNSALLQRNDGSDEDDKENKDVFHWSCPSLFSFIRSVNEMDTIGPSADTANNLSFCQPDANNENDSHTHSCSTVTSNFSLTSLSKSSDSVQSADVDHSSISLSDLSGNETTGISVKYLTRTPISSKQSNKPVSNADSPNAVISSSKNINVMFESGFRLESTDDSNAENFLNDSNDSFYETLQSQDF